MGRTITIDPITRLEGHGKISIFLDDRGDVERAVFQVPELRGFEGFCVGRPAEEMPQITSRICGVCPTAHHMAATKALDALYGVTPPATARAIRELFYNLFLFEDHTLHFYFLAGPDFVLGPDADPAQRNVLGLIKAVGQETGKRVIEARARARALMTVLGGKPIHPVLGLPGGVAKGVTEQTRGELQAFAAEAVQFARFSLQIFHDLVLGDERYREMILSPDFAEQTHYMGLVDDAGRVAFYDGSMRVVDPAGREVVRFTPAEYAEVLAEHVEPWSYIKFPYLRAVGFKGFVGGADSGLVRVAPLARLNVAAGMPTPEADVEYKRLFETLGGKPAHHTLATHWARLVELLCAAERIGELAAAPELTGTTLRNMDLQTPREGVGLVEAPRGTLIHHYRTDARGLLTEVNLLVATLFNSAPICMSIERAARAVIRGGEVSPGLLNRVEMAFRAYDPCLSCATHSLPGRMPLEVTLRRRNGAPLARVLRGAGGEQRVEPLHGAIAEEQRGTTALR